MDADRVGNSDLRLSRHRRTLVAPSCPRCGVTHGPDISQRELAALWAYAATGDQREAAELAGMKYETLKTQLGRAYCKLHVRGAIDAFRMLGWLVAP